MIYFMRAGADGMVKIGYTKNQATLERRRATLQIAHPKRLSVIRTLEGERLQEACLGLTLCVGLWRASTPFWPLFTL